MRASDTAYKMSCKSWVIYAQFKDMTLAPVQSAYKRACDAAKDAQDMAKGKFCGYTRKNIKSFIVCRRDDNEIIRFDNKRFDNKKGG